MSNTGNNNYNNAYQGQPSREPLIANNSSSIQERLRQSQLLRQQRYQPQYQPQQQIQQPLQPQQNFLQPMPSQQQIVQQQQQPQYQQPNGWQASMNSPARGVVAEPIGQNQNSSQVNQQQLYSDNDVAARYAAWQSQQQARNLAMANQYQENVDSQPNNFEIPLQDYQQVSQPTTLDARQQFNNDNKEDIMKFLFTGCVILINWYVLPETNTNCHFDSTMLNAVFGLFVVLPLLVAKLACLSCWNTANHLRTRLNVLAIMQILLYSAWFYYTCKDYGQFTASCYNPFPSYSLILFVVILIFTLPMAVMMMLGIICLVCFAPCIIYQMVIYYRRTRERSRQTEQVIAKLTKIKYSQLKMQGKTPECTICMLDFEDDSEVTPLSCDIRHFFHYECIEPWMKVKNECPMCREVVKPADLKEFKARLEQQIADNKINGDNSQKV